MGRNTYIDHLAGLRGIAILLVVLFHVFGQGMWANGYLGVDIFLVIAGYLIFRSRLASPGAISWRGFFSYLLRRIQRIVPPMVVLILISVFVGMLLLWWTDESLQCKLGYAACLAKANVMLRGAFANYFAPDSAYMPLLHLWYLSVILQVYLLYAVGNQLLQHLPRKVITAVLIILGAVSLLHAYSTPLTEMLSALGVPTDNLEVNVSYYQTLPRLWEVLAGALVCILPNFKHSWLCRLAAFAGMLCVLFSAFSPAFLEANTLAKFPYTLITVTGTVLLLRYTPQCRIIHMILSHKVFVWLGSISFSLYLVHLPVVVYLRVWSLGQPSLWVELLMLILSLPLGFLLMVTVEKRRFPLWSIVLLWAITFLLCRAGRRTGGFRNYLPASNWEIPAYTGWKMCDDESLARGLSPERFPLGRDVFNVMNQLDKMPTKYRAPLMVMGCEQEPVTCVLMGDSHAASLFAGLDVALKDEQISGVYLVSYIYPFHGWEEDKKPNYRTMPEREKALMHWLRSHPSITHVIVAQKWHARFDPVSQQQHEKDLRIFLQELRRAGKKVVLFAPTPEFPHQPPLLHFDKAFSLRHISPAEVEKTAAVCDPASYLRINQSILPILYKMRDEGLCVLIEPLQALQPGEVFRAIRGNSMLMIDDNHMDPGLSIPLVEKLRPFLREALK